MTSRTAELLETTILKDELTKICGNDNVITPSFQKAYERHFTLQADRLRQINGAEVNKGMHGYLNDGSLPNWAFDASHDLGHSAHGANDKQTGFGYKANDKDVTISTIRSKYSMDNCLLYCTGLGLSSHRQTGQSLY